MTVAYPELRLIVVSWCIGVCVVKIISAAKIARFRLLAKEMSTQIVHKSLFTPVFTSVFSILCMERRAISPTCWYIGAPTDGSAEELCTFV